VTQYTITLPCKITYTYNPEEEETRHSPRIAEEFTVERMYFGKTDIIPFFDADYWDTIDAVISNYILEIGKDE
jgi:hypothetical protein